MGITTQMDMREIRDYLNREAQKQIQQVVALLQYVGETVVNDIRTSHISNWTDQTGNLRSSVGYILSVNGRPVGMSDFAVVVGPKAEEGADENGSQLGRDYAQSLAALYPSGIALIVVAGMEYASYVEKRDNKTVLAQGEIEARKLVEQMIRELNQKTSGK